MSRKSVYLVEDLGDVPEANLDFVDQEDLDSLLEEGYSIKSRLDKTIKGVDCEKIDLTDGKELAISEGESAQAVATITKGIADGIAEGMKGALTIPDTSSHLGAPRSVVEIDGIAVRSGNVLSTPFDQGVTDYNRGRKMTDNPFDAESEAGIAWTNGFLKMSDVGPPPEVKYSPEDLAYAEKEGYRMARSAAKQEKDGEEVSVGCAYSGKKLDAWKEGFKRGGGKLE